MASTLAGRWARLDARLTKDDREQLTALAGGVDLGTIAHQLVETLDPDHQAAVSTEGGVADGDDASIGAVAATLVGNATGKAAERRQSGSPRFVVNGPAERGVHAAVRAALASRIRAR
jgi:hypothetical protein